jgi:3alpha(or 20beta)-hydroxysteroid dehydrogenase
MGLRLAGKVALISGGARGQGAAIAAAMVAEGASVVVGDVLDDLGETVAGGLGPQGAYVHLDVTDEAQWSAALDRAVSAFGPVTVLLNNAGILRQGTLDAVAVSEYQEVVAVNQFGCFLGMRAVIPGMRAAGGGSIVNTSSVAGVAGTAGVFAYTTSKWAVRGMTRAAALELGPDGIRVNSVHPGTIDTPMIHMEGYGDDLRRAHAASLPLRRLGRPGDIVGLMVFLASDESEYCTGAEFIVDGGATAGARR